MRYFLRFLLLPIIVSSLSAYIWLHYAGKPEAKNLRPIEGSKLNVLNVPIGQFLISVQGKEKTDKGFNFKFLLGNHNFATYKGLNFKVSWGKPAAKKDEKPSLKSQDFKLETVKAGTWKGFSVTIAETDESELQIVKIEVLGADEVLLQGQPSS